MNASQALAAFADLSLYTNAESCPMCASAIRWAGFKEYIYGTSIEELTAQGKSYTSSFFMLSKDADVLLFFSSGWGQINISSQVVFRQSFDLPSRTRLVADVLNNETDPYFSWQFRAGYPCPKGCSRKSGGDSCGID